MHTAIIIIFLLRCEFYIIRVSHNLYVQDVPYANSPISLSFLVLSAYAPDVSMRYIFHSDRAWHIVLLILPSATLAEYGIAQYTYYFHLWCKAIFVLLCHTEPS